MWFTCSTYVAVRPEDLYLPPTFCSSYTLGQSIFLYIMCLFMIYFINVLDRNFSNNLTAQKVLKCACVRESRSHVVGIRLY